MRTLQRRVRTLEHALARYLTPVQARRLLGDLQAMFAQALAAADAPAPARQAVRQAIHQSGVAVLPPGWLTVTQTVALRNTIMAAVRAALTATCPPATVQAVAQRTAHALQEKCHEAHTQTPMHV